jgi:hypothetical protein
LLRLLTEIEQPRFCRSEPHGTLPLCHQIEFQMLARDVQSACAGEEKSKGRGSNHILVTEYIAKLLLSEENLFNDTFVVDCLHILGYSNFAQVVWWGVCRQESVCYAFEYVGSFESCFHCTATRICLHGECSPRCARTPASAARNRGSPRCARTPASAARDRGSPRCARTPASAAVASPG